MPHIIAPIKRYIVVPSVMLSGLLVGLLLYTDVFGTSSEMVRANTTDTVYYPHEASMQTIPLLRAATHIDPNPAKGGGDIMVSDGALVPSRSIDGKDTHINTKTKNGEISVYVVRDGDTLSQIAEMFDISAKTILWANDIKNVATIQPGDALIILPITGVRHVVKSGDTIDSIAKKYAGNVEDILAYNQLATASDVHIGDTIVIPDGTISTPAPTPKSGKPSKGGSVATVGGGSSGFTYPVPGAVRSQGIHGYNGVDLAAPAGTPVLAASGGEVIIARASGWNGGYGSYVVIKHPNGTQTLYAHLSSVNVAVGERVTAGEKIGGVGNTGRSTGNHLHFEVRGARNPF